MPYRSCSHPDELLFLKVGGHTLFLVAKVRIFDGPVVFRGKRYIPVMPDLIGHLSCERCNSPSAPDEELQR